MIWTICVRYSVSVINHTGCMYVSERGPPYPRLSACVRVRNLSRLALPDSSASYDDDDDGWVGIGMGQIE